MTIYVYPVRFDPPEVASGDEVLPWDGVTPLLEKLLGYPKEVEVKPVVPREWEWSQLFCKRVGEANLNRIYSQMAIERNMVPGLKNLLSTYSRGKKFEKSFSASDFLYDASKIYIVGAGPSASLFNAVKVQPDEIVIASPNSPVRYADILCVCDVAEVKVKTRKALWYVATPTAYIDKEFTEYAYFKPYPSQDFPLLHDVFASVFGLPVESAILSNVGSMMLNVACSIARKAEIECFGLDLCVHALEEASARWGASTVQLTMDDGTIVYTNPDFLNASKAWGDYHTTYPNIKFKTHSKLLPIDGFEFIS